MTTQCPYSAAADSRAGVDHPWHQAWLISEPTSIHIVIYAYHLPLPVSPSYVSSPNPPVAPSVYRSSTYDVVRQTAFTA